ncbi:Bifunctional protein FolC, partial [Haemophilus influenzae]
IGNGKIKKCG